MSKLIKVILLSFSLSLNAAESHQTFHFGQEKNSFYVKDRFLLNIDCKDCAAKRAIEKYKIEGKKMHTLDIEGGKNPHSVYCTKVMGGRSIFGKSLDKRTKLFCYFDDKSLLSFL